MLTDDDVEKLTTQIAALGLPEDALDEAVIDAKEMEASNINNDGFIAQIEYLFGSYERAKKALPLFKKNVKKGRT